MLVLGLPVPRLPSPQHPRACHAVSAPAPRLVNSRAARPEPSAAERVEWDANGQCAPPTGGAARVSGRAAVAAVLGPDALADGDAAPPTSDDTQTVAAAGAQASVTIAGAVRAQAEQTQLDPSNVQHRQVIDAVSAWGKVDSQSLPFAFTAETTMPAIVDGLSEPVVLPALGLGPDLALSMQHGNIQAHLVAGLTDAGVPDGAVDEVKVALAQDALLLSAQEAGSSWQLRSAGEKSLGEHWRKGLKRMRTWFLEAAFYRVLAKLKLPPPTLDGSEHDKAAVTLLQPGSIQGGMAGQVAAAGHLERLLAPSANKVYKGFGGYANAISTTNKQNREAFETSAKGITLRNCCRRYCKARGATCRRAEQSAGGSAAAAPRPSTARSDGGETRTPEQSQAQAAADAPSTSAQAQQERPATLAPTPVPRTPALRTVALSWPVASCKRRTVRSGCTASSSKRHRAGGSPDAGGDQAINRASDGPGVLISPQAS